MQLVTGQERLDCGERMIEILNTDRLLMRPFDQNDLPSLTQLQAEESFWWFPLRRAMTVEESANFLARMISSYESDSEPSQHAVVERSTGALAGWGGLSIPRFLPQVLPAVEITWRLGSAFRGRGYATELGAAALEWGFTTLGLDEIIAIFEPANVASGRVMDHLGFGVGRPMMDDARDLPLLVRSLSARDWRLTR
jgi:RimJ/RimL family protein N-acetyltransferase